MHGYAWQITVRDVEKWRSDHFVGAFQLDLAYVYNQPQHEIFEQAGVHAACGRRPTPYSHTLSLPVVGIGQRPRGWESTRLHPGVGDCAGARRQGCHA